MEEECCGWDFLEWVGPDTSACVFRRLDDPADLVRAGAVSRSWRRFVVENDFSKSLCLRICPDVANFTRAVEVSRSPPPPQPTAPAPESSHDAELKSRERDYRIYSYLSGALVSTKPSMDCILHCIGASSTDNFPDESMENTLEPQDRVTHRPSYWSSGGQDDPDVPESLTYRLNSDICIIDEIRVQPFKAYFQHGHPIYSSKTVQIRMGHSKLPHWSESFVTDEDENQTAIADENYVWTYTSPEFPMPQENVLQSFKLPRPVLCIGGVVKIELLGRVQKQATDDRYYICVCHTQVIGHSLSPVFVVDISAPAGYSILKYLPGAKNLWAEYEKSMRRRHEAATTSDTYSTQPDSAFHRSIDLHREILELVASAQQMTLGDTRGVLQRIAEKARQGIQIVTCRTSRDPVDRPVRGRGVSQGGSRPQASAPNVAGMSSWHRGGSTAGHFGDPVLHRHAGQEYAESSGHTFVPPDPELHPYAG